MANFKVVYRDERPAWQPGCPILVEVVQVARDTESQRAFLQVRARNVSGGTVGAIEAEALVTSPDGSAETVPLSTLDADVPPNANAPINANRINFFM